jgi:ATP-dependent DNA helicase DinG
MTMDLPVAIGMGHGAVIDGAVTNPRAALRALSKRPHLTCHTGFLVERLATAANARGDARLAREQKHFDVAELFVFVCPARAATPTPLGFARALALDPGRDDTETLRLVADDLIARLANRHYPFARETAEVAHFLARGHWPWAKPIMQALMKGHGDMNVETFATGLNVWDRLDEWEDDGPRPKGSQEGVGEDEARAKLRDVLGSSAEARPEQFKYAATATFAFEPRQKRIENNTLLIEAGTGLGKTLGYLVPSYLWARKNHAPVWISTYTKNLQRQLEQETRRLIEEPEEQRSRVVIRKGRENYLCLLNMQELFGGLMSSNARSALLAALIARWARFSRDGDMVGGDFPSWLLSLFSDLQLRALSPSSLGLTDRRGECIYASCPHFKKCFIESNQRAARKADIVIANHALVLTQAATDFAIGRGQTEEEDAAPGGLKRLVFDEGHHLFDAADSAFSGHLTGLEMAELRRWLRGPESGQRRGRGLVERMDRLAQSDEATENLVERVLNEARVLPQPGWMGRLQSGHAQGEAERFLALVRQQVLARADENGGYSLETDCQPMVQDLREAARDLAERFVDFKDPMAALAKALLQMLDDHADELASHERGRIEALARSLQKRGELVVGGWISMLDHLAGAPESHFVEWFSVEQNEAQEFDCGMHTHWIDPTQPLAQSVLQEADGVIITSATLKDRPPDVPDDWTNAEMRTGAAHLPFAAKRASHDSPFDYAHCSRVIVVTDVTRDDMDQVASAYRELFSASGGGGLGLFTAISRLRAVHRRILESMALKGLPLYAQHVDPMDTGTLVDMFRAERDACLLGTDAVRDGVDVPGDSLRLIVMDRVPWGTPSILERARRQLFGEKTYADMIVRLRLRQAFGRLIRSQGDRGVFVVLDPRMNRRFSSAFPGGVTITRLGLVEAIEEVQRFMANRHEAVEE